MAIRTSARFATPQDYENYFGENLSALFDNKSSNPSNYVDLLLMQVEDRIITWVNANTFRLYPWENLNDYQKECMCMAIIIQLNYIIRNGNLTYESGIDNERGVILPIEVIRTVEICQATIDKLKDCGLFNHKVQNLPRRTRTFW